MRVTIEHSTQQIGGMFSKKSVPCIKLDVEFSEVELAVIKQAGLAQYEFYTYPGAAHHKIDMSGRRIIEGLLKTKPYIITFDDIAQARTEEVKIREGLKAIKQTIERNAEPLKAKDTFEL